MSRISPLRFDAIGAVVAAGGASSLFWAGVALLLVGFSFKCGLAPFHQWTPDVYDGSPTPVTAYMGAVVKAAAFAPFFRFFLEDLGRGPNGPLGTEVYAHWVMIVGAIAILTMTWANLAAVAQPSLKRMLAYSSVAHAGYIIIALVAEDRSSLLFYLLAYTLMVVGSFGCAALLRRRNGDEAILIDEWAGVGLRYPWLGGAMALFMFALAGFPPTAGFMGKLYIFRAALEAGAGAPHQNGYVALVAIALINSLVSVYYYLRVVLVMYRPEPGPAAEYYVDRSAGAVLAIFLCAAGVLILGAFPQIIVGPLARVYGM
jgi:NADH-quinone oxidoreductase subunit N